MGRTVFSGAATPKKGKKGATEQLSLGSRRVLITPAHFFACPVWRLRWISGFMGISSGPTRNNTWLLQPPPCKKWKTCWGFSGKPNLISTKKLKSKAPTQLQSRKDLVKLRQCDPPEPKSSNSGVPFFSKARGPHRPKFVSPTPHGPEISPHLMPTLYRRSSMQGTHALPGLSCVEDSQVEWRAQSNPWCRSQWVALQNGCGSNKCTKMEPW